MNKIIIIGGGASGLVSAIYAAKKGHKVTILEKNNICGKKILKTGNGRCNYFNENQDIKNYNSQNIELAEQIITKENQKRILEFFTNLGIEPKIKNGYYYPFSNQAVSIQNALLTEAKNLNIEIKNNVSVEDIEIENNIFVIKTNEEKLYSEKLILSTGSKADSKTGSDGKGYEICKKLGHKIIEPLPALVGLKSNEKFLKEWSGIRAEVSIQSYENEKKIDQEIGEIQLTDYGINGICVMNLSSKIARGLEKGNNEYVKINFLSGLNINTEEEFIRFMEKRNNTMKNRTITEVLEGVINYKLINILLKKSKIDKNKKWKEISQDNKEEFTKNIISMTLNIIGTNSFDKAQVCSGGIALNEININTMESKKIKNLYITGELLDVDGKCGGYNLTWAWITGMLAGENVGDENK